LSVEEWPDGQLVVKGDMDNYVEYARKLLEQGEYFGAFARIHVLVEIWMQNLYEQNFRRSHALSEMHKLVSDTGPKNLYRFARLVDHLVKEKLICPEEADRLRSFSNLRDRILHRMLKYSFQAYPWHIVKKDEALKGFEEGVVLAKLVRDKCGGEWMMIARIPIKAHSRGEKENPEVIKEEKQNENP
jgi:hypothetical protein